MTITVHSDGALTRGGSILSARVVGTSPRELVHADRSRIDVTHVWHSHDFSAILAALMDETSLPAGYHLRQRSDGMPMVGIDR